MRVAHRSSLSRRSSNGLGTPSFRSRSQERSVKFASTTMTCDASEKENGQNGVVALHGRIYRNAASDPFDDAGEDVVSPAVHPSRMEDMKRNVLPTLPRFPVTQSRDLNCWSEPPVSIFNVRGKDYLTDKRKVSSGPYLLEARGCDLLLTDDASTNIGRNPSMLGGALRKVPTFIINLRFPWGMMVFYFEIPSKFCPFLRASRNEQSLASMEVMTPAEQTLARFFMGDEKHKNESLKLIPYVAEGPWVVRNLVTGKPSVIGTKLPVSYTYGPRKGDMAEYLEADLDIGNSSQTAKRIVSVCRRYMSALTVDVGFVVQGNTPAELPEQMLGSIRIHGPDPIKAPSLPN